MVRLEARVSLLDSQEGGGQVEAMICVLPIKIRPHLEGCTLVLCRLKLIL